MRICQKKKKHVERSCTKIPTGRHPSRNAAVISASLGPFVPRFTLSSGSLSLFSESPKEVIRFLFFFLHILCTQAVILALINKRHTRFVVTHGMIIAAHADAAQRRCETRSFEKQKKNLFKREMEMWLHKCAHPLM